MWLVDESNLVDQVQVAFRAGYSAVVNMFTLLVMIQKILRNEEVYLVLFFIDFENAPVNISQKNLHLGMASAGTFLTVY